MSARGPGRPELRGRIALRAAALTVVAVVAATTLGGCAEEEKGIAHPTDRLHYPVTLAADPNGRYLYVVNSNFDVRYRTGSVIAIDLDTHELVPSSAVGIGDFGGELSLLTVSDPDAGYRLVGYVPSRGERELTWFTIAGGDGEAGLTTDCGDDAGAFEAGEIRECQDDHVIRSAQRRRLPRDDVGLEPQEIADADDDIGLSLGLDVYGSSLYPGRDGVSDYLLVTNPRSGRVGVFHVGGGYPMEPDDPGQAAGDSTPVPEPSGPGEPVFLESVFVGQGVYDVAVPPGDDRAYATSRFLNAIIPFRITETPDPAGNGRTWPRIVELAAYAIANTSTIGDFGRDIVFDAAGTRAYVAYRNPSSVVVIDTTPDDDGVRPDRFVDAVDVGFSPTSLALADSGPDGRTRLYVVSFRAEQVWVLDAASLTVEDVIDVPGGPFDIAVVGGPGEARFRAYVTMFEEDAVAAIELDRTSPFFHQPIAYIRGVDDEGAHQ